METSKIRPANNNSIIGDIKKHRRKRKKFKKFDLKNCDPKTLDTIVRKIIQCKNNDEFIFGIDVVINKDVKYKVIDFTDGQKIKLERTDKNGNKIVSNFEIIKKKNKAWLIYTLHAHLTHEPWGLQGKKNLADFNIWWFKRKKAITNILIEITGGNNGQ